MNQEKDKDLLESLGYSTFWSRVKTKPYPEGGFLARVTAEHKELYRIKGATGEYQARITGRQSYQAEKREDYPAVGDWVVATSQDGEHALIEQILPRQTVLQKKYTSQNDTQLIATNIDTAFITESAGRDFNLNRYERYLVLVQEGGIEPVFILNKVDLLSAEVLQEVTGQLRARFPQVELLFTSLKDQYGIEALQHKIQPGKTYCFLGSSGVGKSSLINTLLKDEKIPTQTIGVGTGRGKHTTTGRQLYLLANGGILIDTPGTRAVGLTTVNEGMQAAFQEITQVAQQCKFPDCTHVHEPGCAIIAAIQEGKIDQEQYQNFLKLKKESDFFCLSGLERRHKDRKFGQFVKKYNDQQRELR